MEVKERKALNKLLRIINIRKGAGAKEIRPGDIIFYGAGKGRIIYCQHGPYGPMYKERSKHNGTDGARDEGTA
jgi:hypothetical protein